MTPSVMQQTVRRIETSTQLTEEEKALVMSLALKGNARALAIVRAVSRDGKSDGAAPEMRAVLAGLLLDHDATYHGDDPESAQQCRDALIHPEWDSARALLARIDGQP